MLFLREKEGRVLHSVSGEETDNKQANRATKWHVVDCHYVKGQGRVADREGGSAVSQVVRACPSGRRHLSRGRKRVRQQGRELRSCRGGGRHRRDITRATGADVAGHEAAERREPSPVQSLWILYPVFALKTKFISGNVSGLSATLCQGVPSPWGHPASLAPKAGSPPGIHNQHKHPPAYQSVPPLGSLSLASAV